MLYWPEMFNFAKQVFPFTISNVCTFFALVYAGVT